MEKSMDKLINRFIDPYWHHYAKLYPSFKLFRDWNEYKNADGRKISYLVEFCPSTENIPKLTEKIRKHLGIADHVYVDLGEPGFSYKDINAPIDKTTGRPTGRYYGTVDFINDNFKQSDCVTFFGCVVPLKQTVRPLYFFNDMFFQDILLYQTNDFCINLLKKLKSYNNKKQHCWEVMCSKHTDIYKQLKNHAVDRSTFSTCHALGISSWSKDVVAPTNTPAENISNDSNIRCSDLIDPEIYNNSYYSCVIETVIPADNSFAMFSEKEAKPIIAKRPFIIVGSKDHLKAFRNLGFKTFSPVIDESYDDEPNKDKRVHMIFDTMEKLSKKDPVEVYQALEPILEHNKKHFENKNNWNKEFLDAWKFGTINL